MKTGFFAYSSYPTFSGESIEASIEKINESSVAKIISWTTLKISGKIIINEILETIDKCDFVCADLTGLNDNVLFEIGYALAKNKPLWLTFDTSHSESVKRFKELNFLTHIGYAEYHNTQDLINNFYTDQPYDYKSGLFQKLIADVNEPSEKKALLFLKAQFDTNYNQIVLSTAEHNKLPLIVDDACETKIQSLSWYIKHLKSVPAVICEYSSNSRSGYQLQNSKAAFVAGIAVGLELKTLMIAEAPYDVPIDYRGLLKKFTNRQTCIEAVSPFLQELHEDIATLLTQKKDYSSRVKERSQLQKINFGEYIAEHESEELYDYYVETSHIQNLVKTEYNIVIGRKGSGKTATFYYLQNFLEQDKRNILCTIKPVNFEIDGLIAVLEQCGNEFEKGYLIEAVWKFLIYTEIGKTIYERIKQKPRFTASDKENEFIEYVEKNKTVILADFSSRLDEQITKLLGEHSSNQKQSEFKLKISEVLHDSIIFELREYFADVVSSKNRIIVLIDNLDKSWRKNAALNVIGKCILGLLGVTGRISKELSFIKSKQAKLSFHLTLFLRSDIFNFIISQAREPDKIENTRLKWNDPEIFFRIIEKRFMSLNENKVVSPEEFWLKYITAFVGNISVKNYIIDRVFPRPRDIIFFFKSAKDLAVSRGHSKIEAEDIKSAYEEYSNWVFTSVLVENGITLNQMEDFMYHLIGENAIIDREFIIKNMTKAGIDASSDEKVDSFINHLVSLTIIGREIEKNRFEYDYDGGIRLKILAEKFNSNRFKIHMALIPYLGCPNFVEA